MHMASDPCRYVLGLPVTAPARTRVLLQHRRAHARVGHHPQGDRTPPRRICARSVVRAHGHYRIRVDSGQGRFRCGRGIALATARYGKNRPARPRGWSLERPPDRFESMDRDLDGAEAQGHGQPIRMGICGGSAARGSMSVRSHWIGALGRGGQSIRIVPELDLVVAVTAGYYQDYSPQAFQVQSGVFGTYCGRFHPRGNSQPPPLS